MGVDASFPSFLRSYRITPNITRIKVTNLRACCFFFFFVRVCVFFFLHHRDAFFGNLFRDHGGKFRGNEQICENMIIIIIKTGGGGTQKDYVVLEISRRHVPTRRFL